MGKPLKLIKLEPGDNVLCDPDYGIDQLNDNKKPNCVIPGRVLYATSRTVYVEIMDDTHNGKKKWNNTDQYGSTSYCLIQAVIKN